MNLVIVESPAKAKTINKYLGKDYLVLASYGHIRDLPSKNGSVDPEKNFEMQWEIDSFSKKYLKEITDAVDVSDKIILATDPDREGEAIAWHVKEYLSSKKKLKDKILERVVFNEITKNAILKAIENPRQIEIPLVEAYLARRALDYLVGFNISPILWTKLPGSKSAGRVQSVALKLITEREHEIELFKPEEYWTLSSEFTNLDNKNILSKLSLFEGEKIERFTFKNKAEINKAIKIINKSKFTVKDINSKVHKRNPLAPFTTSTLQQTASGKFGFGASRTMQIAQRLYQGVDIEGETTGLITYMRTDGTQISQEAISEFRELIKGEYGKEYLPETINTYEGKKAKNAQEAHEAIRPTNINRKPNDIKKYVNADQFKLYELIWSRALSSQMNPAEFYRNSIIISSSDGKINFRANGSIVKFDGFLKVYEVPDTDDDIKNILPECKVGENVNILKLNDEQHFTDPPPRYSEASLVKKMEELGIGRPSTYASIISVLSTRNYVEQINKRFHPTDRGKLISAFLEKLFTKYVDYNFTADLENQLDDITSGNVKWDKVLENFWKDFYANVTSVKEKRTREVLDLLNESLGELIFDIDKDNHIDRKCKICSDGILSLKNSFRGGAFIGCSNYPECKFTRPLSKSKAAAQSNLSEPKLIGQNQFGKDIFLKNGRFGPYLQYEKEIEANTEIKKKKGRKKILDNNVKNVSIPKGLNIDDVNLDKANFLCSLPRTLGQNPETGKDIILNVGRFGPYLKSENKSARIENVDEIFSIGLNRAITLIAEAKPGRMSSSVIKDLDIPQGLIEKIIRKNQVKVNNKKTKSSYRVQENDIVELFNIEKIEETKKKIITQYIPSISEKAKYDDFIIEDNDNFVVINKPSGIPVQSGTKSFKNIIDALRKTKYFENAKPFIVHRLDKDTSGILIVAKNREYAQLFTSLFRLRKIHKTYLAIVYGEIPKGTKILEDELILYENDKKIIQNALSYLKLLKTNSQYSLLELRPITGRKHQLRKQLYNLGNPIIGDDKYFFKNRGVYIKSKYLMLHAYEIKFMINDVKYNFSAPLNENFSEFLNKKNLNIF